jgi:putative ATPase
MERTTFYRPTGNGYEQHVRQRLQRWAQMRADRRRDADRHQERPDT